MCQNMLGVELAGVRDRKVALWGAAGFTSDLINKHTLQPPETEAGGFMGKISPALSRNPSFTPCKFPVGLEMGRIWVNICKVGMILCSVCAPQPKQE